MWPGVGWVYSFSDDVGSIQNLLLGIHTALCLVSFGRSKTPIVHSLPIELICKIQPLGHARFVLCQVGMCPYPSSLFAYHEH